MKPLASRGVCLIAAVLAAAHIAYAQRPGDPGPDPGTAGVTGRIALPSGEFAGRDIKVVMRTEATPVVISYTDQDGRFTLMNVYAGTYYIEVTGDEKKFEPVVEQIELRRSQQRSVTIYLREKQAFRVKSTGAVTSSAALGEDVPDSARKEYERATKLVKKGDINRAIEHFKLAIALYPNLEAAHNDLGVQYLKLKQFDSAVEQFQAALAINARAFNPRLNLGITLVDQKQYAVAIDQLNQALEIDRGSPAAFLYMGIARTELDDLQAAYADLSKALILGGPAFATAHYYLGKVHLKRDERDEALKSLKAYLEAMPTGELADSAKTLVKRLE